MELPAVLEVTQADIDEACTNYKEKDAVTDCVVACALRRITGNQWHVGSTMFWLPYEKYKTMSKEVREFVQTYCNAEPLKPTTFTNWYQEA